MPVRTLQRRLNDLFAAFALPIRHITVDGVRGSETIRAIATAKLALGWLPKYATGERTPAFYLALATRGASMLPRQRARGRAWRHRYRNSQDPAAVARRILNHPRARFAFSSPTGGTARSSIAAAAMGGKAYVAATNRRVTVSPRILRFIEYVLDHATGPVFINCVCNGRHRDGSTHYQGLAADIDKASHTSTARLQAAAKAAGVRVLDEDAFHWHVYDAPNP